MMKLIGSLGSPFVRKARIVLADKKIDYKLVLENVWAPDTTIHTFNPLGKVPCLVMEDGEAVFDSRVICEYVGYAVAGRQADSAVGPRARRSALLGGARRRHP